MTWVGGRGNLLSRPADVRREAQWVLAGELIRDGYVLDRRGPALLYSPTINEALPTVPTPGTSCSGGGVGGVRPLL